MSSISNITTSAHAALSSRGTTSSAAAELQTLVSKLHLDSIPSASATSGATTSGTSASATSGKTGLVSSFRDLFDHALDAAKEARATAKSVTSATHGAGLAGLAATAASKIL